MSFKYDCFRIPSEELKRLMGGNTLSNLMEGFRIPSEELKRETTINHSDGHIRF